ncbi:MAG: DUF2442 domain-containing protein [Oscillospiraceae bacterium]|nr:DUF2442 domain-containing protein [Oscillospiraceae bacterium]
MEYKRDEIFNATKIRKRVQIKVMAIPKIVSVKPIEDMQLIVSFDDGAVRKYDVKKLFSSHPVFKKLEDKELFESVKVDMGGSGLAWNDDIDLAEYEIWKNGERI